MKINEIIKESKPSSFPSIHQRGLDAFKLQRAGNKYNPVGEASAFRVYVKNNKKIYSEVYRYPENIQKYTYGNIIKEDFLQQLQSSNNTFKQIYGDDYINNLSENDIGILPIYENEPRIQDDGDISPNVVPTDIENIVGYISPDNTIPTIDTIKREITIHSRHQHQDGKIKYYDKLLDHLINNTEPKFPFELVTDKQDYLNSGFHGTRNNPYKEILNEFGEIAGPIGLICGTINGNATRLLPYFFREKEKIPSNNEIKQKAQIFFHPSAGKPLVDSYIKFNNKVLRVSSKSAGSQLSGGSGASPIGLYQSLEEIYANKEALDRFRKLIRTNPGLKDEIEILRKLSKSFTASEEQNNLNGYINHLELLNDLSDTLYANNNDIAILRKIWKDSGSSDAGMHSNKISIGAALGNISDKRKLNSLSEDENNSDEFSPEFKNLLRSFDLNRYGEPATKSGVEKIGSNDNSERGWWLRLQKGLTYQISKLVSNRPNFSKICAWILNHGAFCQIDMRSQIGQNESLVISNIVATWPSTVVDSVKLLPLINAKSGFKFKLDINNNDSFDEAIYQQRLSNNRDILDFDFGFNLSDKTDREIFNKLMTPNKADLSGPRDNEEDDEEDNERNTTRRSILLINTYFNYLNDINAINLNNLNNIRNLSETEKVNISIKLATSILVGNQQNNYFNISNATDIVGTQLWAFIDDSNETRSAKKIHDLIYYSLEINDLYYKFRKIDQSITEDDSYKDLKEKVLNLSDNNININNALNALENNNITLDEPVTNSQNQNEPIAVDDEAELERNIISIPNVGNNPDVNTVSGVLNVIQNILNSGRRDFSDYLVKFNNYNRTIQEARYVTDNNITIIKDLILKAIDTRKSKDEELLNKNFEYLIDMLINIATENNFEDNESFSKYMSNLEKSKNRLIERFKLNSEIYNIIQIIFPTLEQNREGGFNYYPVQGAINMIRSHLIDDHMFNSQKNSENTEKYNNRLENLYRKYPDINGKVKSLLMPVNLNRITSGGDRSRVDNTNIISLIALLQQVVNFNLAVLKGQKSWAKSRAYYIRSLLVNKLGSDTNTKVYNEFIDSIKEKLFKLRNDNVVKTDTSNDIEKEVVANKDKSTNKKPYDGRAYLPVEYIRNPSQLVQYIYNLPDGSAANEFKKSLKIYDKSTKGLENTISDIYNNIYPGYRNKKDDKLDRKIQYKDVLSRLQDTVRWLKESKSQILKGIITSQFYR